MVLADITDSESQLWNKRHDFDDSFESREYIQALFTKLCDINTIAQTKRFSPHQDLFISIIYI